MSQTVGEKQTSLIQAKSYKIISGLVSAAMLLLCSNGRSVKEKTGYCSSLFGDSTWENPLRLRLVRTLSRELALYRLMDCRLRSIINTDGSGCDSLSVRER